MKHGLMFGNFGYQGDWAKVEHYRAFGNHRIATHLRRRGWDIECLDYTSAFTNEELIEYIDSRITKDTVFIGISMIFFVADQTQLDFITRHIRTYHSHVKIISGGVKHFVVTRIDADYYITGNGEYAIEALLDWLIGNADKPKMNNNHINTLHDYQCFPKRDAAISFEERDYIQSNEVLNIEFARGCKFKCTYCSFPLVGLKGDMSRDEDSVYEEMLENYEKWGVTNYYITDDTVNDRPEKITKMANAIKRLPFTPHLSGYARADLLIIHGQKTWDDMINMGFTAHQYGVETFNHKSGKAVFKGMEPEKLKEGLLEVDEYFTKNCHLYYTGTISMIAGLPYETFESLDSSKEWLNKYWSNHGIYYLPLLIQQAKDSNDTDGYDRISEDFKKYGYIYSNDIPEVMRDSTRRSLNELSLLKEKHGDIIHSNFWIHPSNEYDFIDMIEWIEDFTNDRVDNGMTSMHAFSTLFSSLSTEHEQFEYYKRYAPTYDTNKIMNNMIAKYKKNKLGNTDVTL